VAVVSERRAVTREELKAMTPEAILRGIRDGTLKLPTKAGSEFPDLPENCRVVDIAGLNLSFRQFLALNGEADPGPDGSPEDWVCWYLDPAAEDL
jgi:hypothetical protein